MFYAYLQDGFNGTQHETLNLPVGIAISDEDLENQTAIAHHNTLLCKDFETYSTVASGGGWWFEAHCGVVFFCCR